MSRKLKEDMDAQARKEHPLAKGVLDYFPDALLAVANCSHVGNEQHNPGQPIHWAKHKSTDEADALVRHLLDRGKLDSDGVRHSAKVAWRALALLQREIDQERLNAQTAKGNSEAKMKAGQGSLGLPKGYKSPQSVSQLEMPIFNSDPNSHSSMMDRRVPRFVNEQDGEYGVLPDYQLKRERADK